ncbi:AfsR/SARP family transcriptional regulator [Fodinicola acaciae]|uniref:AfsR/SARP family transcriptional regulator n=1 Tax=Fodinicola acaciae TaxID=2681555 RepID=UPI0013D189CE|nr:BTAD domain-containing putative transcriptional regulator [Fodinicola acaciae]
MLTVDLLGALRVALDGRPVELPAGRLRALLAVLALSAGRTVSTDELAAAVWGPEAGGDARANVRTNIKRLRQVLGAAEVIAARPGGYLLNVDPDQVDVLRFGRLLDEAAATSDPATERCRLDAALALWRGFPLDGIRIDRAVGPALEGRYLTTLERRTDLDLAAGSRPEPTALVAAAERHPLRESLCVRLLQVLAAAGRPAEALERYETIRRRLADELGVDPSPELRQVYADLLAGRGPSQLPSVPRQLPPGVHGFAGRECELAALDGLLDPRRRSLPVAVIAGTAGIGKTTLAVHWGHRIASHFPDGQLYLNLRGYDPSDVVRPEAAIREFLDALRVPPHEIPDGAAAQAGLFRSLLAERRMLVLLDNARDADQVIPLLPGASGCLVVVTSREHLTGLVMACGARSVTLDLLPPSEARRLLASRLGADRIAIEPAATDEIIRRCAGLPLALAIAAARGAIRPAHPLDALATELRDALGALDRAAGVRAVFSWSYGTLSEPAARLFRLVAGLHPGPHSTTAATASLAGIPDSQASALLAELARANLLTEPAPDRFSCHDLLRAYAAELCQAHDADRAAARQRVVDHYVRAAEAAAARLASMERGPGDAVTTASWFATERHVLLAVLKLAVTAGLDRQVCALAEALSIFLHRHGHWHDRADVQRAAVDAARRLHDPTAETRALCNLARALADLGRFDDAHTCFDNASQDDPWTHHNRDIVYAIQGHPADALDAAVRAYDLFEQQGDQAGQAIALTDIGWHHGRLGNHLRAVELCEQALVLHQKLGNRTYEAHTLSCLADSHLTAGDPAAAAAWWRQALDLFREISDVYGEASTLAHLGACHHHAGDDVAAYEHWHAARLVLDQLDAYTFEQIYGQLASYDRRAADAFRDTAKGAISC